MSGRIHELLNRNLQKVFGEGDAARRRAAIEDLYTDDCVVDAPPGVFLSGATPWTSSPETCAPLTLTSPTRLTASRRRSITPAVWRRVPARAGRSPITPPWT
jgi:hypothetical protein